jgi:hypothetical protein
MHLPKVCSCYAGIAMYFAYLFEVDNSIIYQIIE